MPSPPLVPPPSRCRRHLRLSWLLAFVLLCVPGGQRRQPVLDIGNNICSGNNNNNFGYSSSSFFMSSALIPSLWESKRGGSGVALAEGQLLRVAGQAHAPTEHHGPVLINVGLPRSGTTTIHMVFLMLNVSSQHIVSGMSKSSVEEFRRGFSGVMKEAFTNPKYQVFGDRPCYGLIPQFRKYFPQTHLVATVRPKMHWLHSMFLNPSTGHDFLRDWAFPSDTVMAAALAAHFNDTRWLTDREKMVYTPSVEVQEFINVNCTSTWRGHYSSSCAEEMAKLERVYITHRHLLHIHDVPIIWTESSNHTQNCGVLTDHFPKGLSEGVDELARCCGSMTEWPVSNAVHDTMWATRNKQNWLNAHNEWLAKQCAGGTHARR